MNQDYKVVTFNKSEHHPEHRDQIWLPVFGPCTSEEHDKQNVEDSRYCNPCGYKRLLRNFDFCSLTTQKLDKQAGYELHTRNNNHIYADLQCMAKTLGLRKKGFPDQLGDFFEGSDQQSHNEYQRRNSLYFKDLKLDVKILDQVKNFLNETFVSWKSARFMYALYLLFKETSVSKNSQVCVRCDKKFNAIVNPQPTCVECVATCKYSIYGMVGRPESRPMVFREVKSVKVLPKPEPTKPVNYKDILLPKTEEKPACVEDIPVPNTEVGEALCKQINLQMQKFLDLTVEDTEPCSFNHLHFDTLLPFEGSNTKWLCYQWYNILLTRMIKLRSEKTVFLEAFKFLQFYISK